MIGKIKKMNVRFSFSPMFFENGFSNDQLYNMRRRVAVMFQDAGYGDFHETPDGLFRNEHIEPEVDGYGEFNNNGVNRWELIMIYHVDPFEIGNFMELITVRIPELRAAIRDVFDANALVDIYYD